MRYFYVKNGVLTEYFGFTKSAAEMAGYATYAGDKSADWLKLDEEGAIQELTAEEYATAHPFCPALHTFSKYEVKKRLQQLEKAPGVSWWEFVKTQLTAEQYENMLLAQDYNLANAEFKLFYDMLAAAGVDIDKILQECVL